MYDDANWTPATGQERARFLETINPVDGKHEVSPETTAVAWRPLPFYERAVLVRVKDPGWTPKTLNIYYLTIDGNLYRLNGTAPPIHEVNALAPVKITEDNVLDYLRFFCYFVHGEEGPFLMAEDISDPHLIADMDGQTKAVLKGALRPATYQGKNEQGFFLCEGAVFYSDMLYISSFSIQPDGMVEMLGDRTIASGLKVKIDAPLA